MGERCGFLEEGDDLPLLHGLLGLGTMAGGVGAVVVDDQLDPVPVDASALVGRGHPYLRALEQREPDGAGRAAVVPDARNDDRRAGRASSMTSLPVRLEPGFAGDSEGGRLKNLRPGRPKAPVRLGLRRPDSGSGSACAPVPAPGAAEDAASGLPVATALGVGGEGVAGAVPALRPAPTSGNPADGAIAAPGPPPAAAGSRSTLVPHPDENRMATRASAPTMRCRQGGPQTVHCGRRSSSRSPSAMFLSSVYS